MMNAIVGEILELSVKERLQIVEEIWDRIVRDPNMLPVSKAEKLELEKRLGLHRQNPDSGIVWEELKSEILHQK